MGTKQQPLALMLADRLHHEQPMVLRIDAEHAGEELLRQHARITALESQLAQRFDAADMATASAQGFRDGAAKEREACAQIADIHALGWQKSPGANPEAGFIASSNCATAIRARGKP